MAKKNASISSNILSTVVFWKSGGTQGAVLRQFQRKAPLHAYLLSGPRGIGKRTFAKILSALLYCSNAADEPCLQCPSCKQVFEETYPQMLTLFADDGKSIGVDQVRDLLSVLSRHSLEDGFRTVLIEPMEKLTPAAQNALLKQLEEPNEKIVFLLMAHEKSAALGTIASRCVSVPLTSWDDGQLRTVLHKNGYSAETTEKLLPRAAGNIGAALEAAAIDERNNEVSSLVKKASVSLKDADMAAISTKLKDDKEATAEFLLMMEEQLVRAIQFACNGSLPSAGSGLSPLWQKAIQHRQIDRLNDLLRVIFEIRKNREYSVNLQCSCDLFLKQLMEAQDEWQGL